LGRWGPYNSGMRVTHHKPTVRGVDQLMYVGDDAAVENAVSSIPTPAKIALAVLVGWLLFGRR